MNALLLCHGQLRLDSSFELAAGQSVQYRGNFGTDLSADVAFALTQALLSNPLITDEQLSTQINHYQPQDALDGPGGFRPDIDLSGDDALPCIFMNMGTRKWVYLRHGWSSRLSTVCAYLKSPLWLNLLCCTKLDDIELTKAGVKQDLVVKSWADVLSN